MDRITIASADELDNAFRAKQRAKRLNKPLENKDDESASVLSFATSAKPKKAATKKGTKKSAAPPVPAPPPSYFEQAQDALEMPDWMPGGGGGGNEGPQDDDEAYKEYERAMQEVASKAHKINMYYQLFPETRPTVQGRKGGIAISDKTWTGEDEPDHIMLEYDRVKLVVNSRSAPQSAMQLVLGLGSGIEYVTMTLGYNPMGANLNGLGEVVTEAAKSPDMKADIDQLSIEYNDYLAARPEIRLLQKIAQCCVMVHVANTSSRPAAAVPPPSRKL